MNQITVWNNADKSHYKRITKRQALKLWLSSKPFVLAPCNLMPFGGWSTGMHIEPSKYTENPVEFGPDSFDYLVFQFELNNCTEKETGRYASFYEKLPMVSDELLNMTLEQLADELRDFEPVKPNLPKAYRTISA